MAILFLALVTEFNIVAYVWLSLVVTIVTVVRVNVGLVLAMTPIVYYYFYRLQRSFIVVLRLKMLYGAMLSNLGGVGTLVGGLIVSLVFLRLVENGLVWLGVGRIYFLGLSQVGVWAMGVLILVYLQNLSGMLAMTLILGFPLTALFLLKVGITLKVRGMLMVVLIPILSFSLGFRGQVPPSFWSLRVSVSCFAGVLF